MAVFVLFLAAIIFFFVEAKLGWAWVTAAFLTGALTSVLSGFIGMRVATYSNYRCAYCA